MLKNSQCNLHAGQKYHQSIMHMQKLLPVEPYALLRSYTVKFNMSCSYTTVDYRNTVICLLNVILVSNPLVDSGMQITKLI